MKNILIGQPQYGANEVAIDGNPVENIRYIRITDIDSFGRLNDDFKTAKVIEEKYLLENNDILFARTGATAGKAFLFKKEYGKAIFAGYLIRFKIDFQKASPNYIFSYSQLSPYKNWVKSIQRPSGQPNINSEEFKELEIPLPDISMQENIVKVFNDAISLKNKKELDSLNILDNIDKTIASKIGFEFPKIKETKIFATKRTSFESRLDPHFYLPNFKSLIDNIRKTDNAQLGDLVEFSKETWNQKDGFEKEFPYIEISEIDLASGKVNNISILPIEEAPSRAKMIVRANDIIVSTTRPHRGAISLITNSLDGFIASTGFAVLRNLKSDIISKEYLYYILRTQICLQQMLQRSSGGSYPAITAEELKNIYIPIPSKEVQNEVVEEIKRYIEEAERLKNEANLEFEVAKKEIENLILN